MINYWWVSRPKRKLDSVPDVLAVFASIALNQQWNGQRKSQLNYESELESTGIKRRGERTDQTGGGARTYKAWLASLGLIYTDKLTGQIMLTEAGKAIITGTDSHVVLTKQILQYQFPSSYSLSRNVEVASRFKIRPFRFLLRLLADKRVGYLTQDEIAKIVVIEAEKETEECFEYIVSRILTYRKYGDGCLNHDFMLIYQSSKGGINLSHPYSHLQDLSNTLINWLLYTPYVERVNGNIVLIQDYKYEISNLLSDHSELIAHPENHECYQQKYGAYP